MATKIKPPTPDPALGTRKTVMLDSETKKDMEAIQQGLRAPTASEALRFAVREMAKLMRMAGRGGQLVVSFPGRKRALQLDIPAVRGA